MQVIDLFSGIGGFSLAAHWVGWETIQFCEADKRCQRVLEKNFKSVPIHSDIKTLYGENIKADKSRPVIVVGGFPCQPYSSRGRRLGKNDDRHLWPEMLRVIRETRPRYVVGENVNGIITWNDGMVFEDICSDLEAEGYEVQAVILPALSVGAYHRRDRVWFIANSNGERRDKLQAIPEPSKENESSWVGDKRGLPDWSELESPIRGADNGLPNRMDRHRLKQLGNSIVPQVAFQIFKAIETIDNKRNL
jgi:DNA (cytosine-5)-methyltransferase 1